MVLKWRENKEIIEESHLSAPFPSDVTFGEIKKVSPRLYVFKAERWCPFNNPETYIRGRKRIDKIVEKLPFKLILNSINNIEYGFTIKDVIKLLKGEGITDGSLQNKILAYMVCMGIVKKNIQRYQDKKKEIKMRYIFIVNPLEKRIPCQYFDKKCNFDWKGGRETKFFDN